MLAIRKKSNMFPLNRLVSEVFAVAKQDLKPGDLLDGIGGCSFYSLIDEYEAAKADNLLPIGLAKGARLVRRVGQDVPIRYDDVELYESSTVLLLRRLQDRWMAGQIDDRELLELLDAIQLD
jgi:predicted homoserine dehydrogenase-like protein